MELVYWSKLMTEAAIINFPETGQTSVWGGGVGGLGVRRLLPCITLTAEIWESGKDVFEVTSGDGRDVSGIPKRKPPHIDLI